MLPCGDELADEGEEVRAMSLTVVASESGAGRRVCSLAVGYSDGVVRVRLHAVGCLQGVAAQRPDTDDDLSADLVS